jgi:hypothetical protein
LPNDSSLQHSGEGNKERSVCNSVKDNGERPVDHSVSCSGRLERVVSHDSCYTTQEDRHVFYSVGTLGADGRETELQEVMNTKIKAYLTSYMTLF